MGNAIQMYAQHHPCSLWVRLSKSHYDWLYQLFVALCDEYTHRYGKVHLTDQKLRHILANCPIMTDTPFIAPPRVMPDEYQSDDTLSAYRTIIGMPKRIFWHIPTARFPIGWQSVTHRAKS